MSSLVMWPEADVVEAWKVSKEFMLTALCCKCNGTGLDNGIRRIANKISPIIDQCYEDELFGAVPYCLMFQRSPKDAKELLGSGVWKSIIKRHPILSAIINSCLHSADISEELMVEIIQSTHNIDASVLIYYIYEWNKDNGQSANFDLALLLRLNRLQDKSEENIERHINMIRDCRRMCNQLDEEFDPSMGWTRLREFHDLLSEKIAFKDLGIPEGSNFVIADKCQEVLDNIELPESISAKVLTSVGDFKNELNQMHHCIFSYCKRSFEDRYVAVHISEVIGDGTTVESTLGISCSADASGKTLGSFNKDQHYGKRNKSIRSHDDTVKSEKLIVSAFNAWKVKDDKLEKEA